MLHAFVSIEVDSVTRHLAHVASTLTSEWLTSFQTRYILEALSECGWKDATSDEQQDASEAFSIITNELQLPLLTLKMDLYHDGVADPKDDHKRVYERLLEVAIPPTPEDGRALTLEECLENYFNNRVEVKRLMERSQLGKLERSNTISSMKSTQSEKGASSHVEVTELSSPSTPMSLIPPTSPIIQTRSRTQSFIRRRIVDDQQADSSTAEPDNVSTRNTPRKQSVRNEVLVPAWYVFFLDIENAGEHLISALKSYQSIDSSDLSYTSATLWLEQLLTSNLTGNSSI